MKYKLILGIGGTLAVSVLLAWMYRTTPNPKVTSLKNTPKNAFVSQQKFIKTNIDINKQIARKVSFNSKLKKAMVRKPSSARKVYKRGESPLTTFINRENGNYQWSDNVYAVPIGQEGKNEVVYKNHGMSFIRNYSICSS